MGAYADVLKIRYTILRHLVGDSRSQRTLEVFLRAIYASYLRHRDEPCTVDLFCVLLEDGFTGEPAPFDVAWMRFLGGSGMSHWPGERLAPRERFEGTILRQIADLHSMTAEQLENIERYLGGRTPSGQSWQHTNLAAFLYLASEAPAFGLPQELGRGRERHSWGEINVIYMEKPEAEFARLETLSPFIGLEVLPPTDAGGEGSGADVDTLGVEDWNQELSFDWDHIADFLEVGQEAE